ncbi:MAG: GAF domain-containing protein [Xanthomonadaceae bacterium]|nr:GAF domain-containing protein [Xanthomonadaceae bacterium]
MQPADDLQKQLLLLNRVGSSLRHTNDFPQVCKTIVKAIIAETNAENCSLYVMDSSQQRLFLRAAMGKQDQVPVFFHDDADALVQFRLGEGILGKAALERHPFFIDDVTQSPEFVLLDASSVAVKSLLCVPVIDGDELLGGINLSHSESGALGQPLLASLEIIADQTAKALKNALLITQLQQVNKHLEQEVVKGYRKLADSERKYRFLVEQAAEGIVTTKDGIILYANPQFCKMAGYDEKVPGTALSDILDLANRQQIMTPCLYRESIDQDADCHKPEFYFETDLKHSHGYLVRVEVTGCPVPDGHGFIHQFYVHDISDQVHLDKMKDTFFASLVHELKTPITVINSYLQQLIGDMKEYGGKRQLFTDLDKASKRLIHLLNDILTYSRLNYAGPQLNMRRWPINDEIFNTIDYFRPLLKKKGIMVTSELQAGLQPFLFDREKIGQVLVNLMDNAIKFTGSGGKIIWHSQEVEFNDSLCPDELEPLKNQGHGEPWLKMEKGISISIEDTGCGIPEVDGQKVFSEFYTSHESEGSGLGLSICRKIVECHGGCISAERTAQGSRFSFILPLRLRAS